MTKGKIKYAKLQRAPVAAGTFNSQPVGSAASYNRQSGLYDRERGEQPFTHGNLLSVEGWGEPQHDPLDYRCSRAGVMSVWAIPYPDVRFLRKERQDRAISEIY